jgi:hypothetical protein
VRAVYVLEKLPDVNGPGLVEAGRYMKHMRHPDKTIATCNMKTLIAI